MRFGSLRNSWKVSPILALAALSLLWSPAEAKKSSKVASKPGLARLFFLKTNLNLSYDDNIINYSDPDLNAFQSDTLNAKFAIETKDDWIITPRIQPGVKGKLLGGHTAWLALEFDYYFYVRNDVRRYSRFAVNGRHYFSPKGYVDLTYSHIPKYYYRNELFNGTFLKAEFAKNALAAEVGYDITNSIKGDVSYQYQHKSFNPEFRFRDLNLNAVELDGIWTVTRPLKVWTFYGFESGKAQGANDPDTIVDVSYTAWDLTVGARHYSSLVPKLKPELYASFQFRRIDFRTDKYSDIYRYGRNDNNLLFRLGTTWHLPYRLDLGVEYSFIQKRAHLPNALYPDPARGIAETASQLEKKLDYNSNTVLLKFSRDF